MKFVLNNDAVVALEEKNIIFDLSKDYSDDEAFELSDAIREVQIFYAQNGDQESLALADKYANIADEIDRQIDAS